MSRCIHNDPPPISYEDCRYQGLSYDPLEPTSREICRFLETPMAFPGAESLLGIRFVFLGMGDAFPGTPALFLGTFRLLGKAPAFPGTLKWFLGIVKFLVYRY
jgi:hypothetical protein